MTSPTNDTRVVRVASGQGFWGDSLEAPRQQVEGGPVDYLMLDYLAGVTMSILQKQKERDPRMGYARDFLGAIDSVLPAIVDRGVRVVANAGGVNPSACPCAISSSRRGSRSSPVTTPTFTRPRAPCFSATPRIASAQAGGLTPLAFATTRTPRSTTAGSTDSMAPTKSRA